MKAYQTNNGYYEAEINCQESPLEPGKFLIPMGVKLKKPPILETEGEDVSQWDENKGDWIVTKNPSYSKSFSISDGAVKYFAKEIPEGYTDKERPSTKHVFFEGEWILAADKKAIEFTRQYLGTKDKTIKTDAEIREILFKEKYDLISRSVENRITGGFDSDVTGVVFRYDSSLTDQFEIDQLERAGIDAKIKALGSDGIKKRYLHSKEQIKSLKSEFFMYVFEVKIAGDKRKESLSSGYLTMDLDELKGYDCVV